LTITDKYEIIRFMIKETLLEQSGLNRSEIKIYKRLLEYGELTPPRLSELTGLTRQNAYAALKTLENKGLIESITRRKKLIYQINDPNRLLALTEQKLSESKLIQESMQSLMPELINMYNLSTNKPGITYFEGVDGIKEIFKNILRDKPEELLIFRSIHDQKRLSKELFGFIAQQSILGIKTRAVSPTVVDEETKKWDKKNLIARKYVPESIFAIDTQINIYNNQVAFLAYKSKPMGFVISSKDVAQTFRTIFELIWQAEFKP
jgi:sugar-specific transcriptional regulator TrmB